MKILSEEKMWNCSAVKVLMKLRLYVILNEIDDARKVSLIDLQQIVEKLMYIACNTQLNIVFMIKCLSQNLTDTQIKHIKL